MTCRVCRSCGQDSGEDKFRTPQSKECIKCEDGYRTKAVNSAPRRKCKIYFIYAPDANLVKIGLTETGVDKRFRMLSNMSPVKLKLLWYFDGVRDDEPELHERFHHLHHHGEWFRYEDDLRDYVEASMNGEVTKTRPLVQDTRAKTYHQLIRQLYSGEPYAFAEYDAAKELWKRGNYKALKHAHDVAKRRTTRSAAMWPFRNAKLIERGHA